MIGLGCRMVNQSSTESAFPGLPGLPRGGLAAREGRALRRVLILAYHFPPIASSGTFRTLKFVKYLRDFGWEPIVLTVDERHERLEPKDPALALQVPPDVAILRTRSISMVRRQSGSGAASGENSAPRAGSGKRRPNRRSLAGQLVRLLSFPDRCVGWYPFAVARGLRAISMYQPDLVYSSAPPFTGSLVGLTLSVLAGKPLVSDFRDAWAGNRYRQAERNSNLVGVERLAARAARALERMVFRRSARVLCVSETQSEAARERAGESATSRFCVITNGFDPDDFSDLKPRPPDRDFRLLYAGCFYPPVRDPRNLLRALALIKERSPGTFSRFWVSFFGEPGWASENAAFLENLRLDRHVEFLPFRPHREALQLMAASDALLLLGSLDRSDTGTVPAKIFEYLALRKPILALVHDGEAARIARASGLGVVADPEDPQAIAAALMHVRDRAADSSREGQPAAPQLRRFERRELTRQLASLFDEVLDRSPVANVAK
jgi:glycosyltransferase involved in cell wall biosynthesis